MKLIFSWLINGALILACSSSSQDQHLKKHKVKLMESFHPNGYNVAFLITDGVYNTEFTAPWDIFHHTRFREVDKPMNLFSVSNTSQPVLTFESLKIQPDFNFNSDSLPRIDILVVPSAEHHLDSDLEDTNLINFVKRAGEEALFVTSHCDGAFLLAQAGILDGIASTTFPSDIELLRSRFPQLKVVDSVMFVHDRNVITSVGGAKSFEGALYLTQYLYGKTVADQLAEGLVIDWNLENVPCLIVGEDLRSVQN